MKLKNLLLYGITFLNSFNVLQAIAIIPIKIKNDTAYTIIYNQTLKPSDKITNKEASESAAINCSNPLSTEILPAQEKIIHLPGTCLPDQLLIEIPAKNTRAQEITGQTPGAGTYPMYIISEKEGTFFYQKTSY